jgi:glutamate synthase domain-containing protein 2
MSWKKAIGIPAAGLAALATHDLLQRRHAILRTFPVIGHARFLLEKIGPELRQYIVTDNDSERPFSRDQRRFIYASSKLENPYFGFGSDNDVEHEEGYAVVKHRTFAPVSPSTLQHAGEHDVVPCAKVLGEARARRHAFRPQSVINVSAMSYGSLSGPAVEALNRGCAAAGVLHNTGEGGIARHHRHGADLIFQIGTAYFGCRDEDGAFSLAKLKELVASAPVRALEVKLSQGAKPGLGGMLPQAKISDEIAQIRGIRQDRDCASPSRHAEFDDVDSMLDWVEMLAEETGLPVGIKSAVGDLTFWEQLADQMATTDRGVDFIAIDGGEGGTGAAPLSFADSVSLPFRLGFPRVYRIFAQRGLTDQIVFMGAGKLGLTDNAAVAFALGVDLVYVARESMISIGCIQAQRCHDDHCPTGVATQNAWLTRGIDVPLKAERAANYLRAWRREMLKIAEACGVVHPALLDPDDVEILLGNRAATPLRELVGYEPGWALPSAAQQEALLALMAPASRGGSAPRSATAR